MRTDDLILREVMVKYKLADEIMPGDPAAMLRSKKKVMAEVMKKNSAFGLFIPAVTALFFWFKKTGISLSIGKAAVVLTVAGVAATTGITFGTYQVIKKIYHDSGILEDNKVQINDVMVDIKQNSRQDNTVLQFKVAVAGISMDGASQKELSGYTDLVISELRNAGGRQAAVSIADLDEHHLSDSILKITIITIDICDDASGMNCRYKISAQLVSRNSSQILDMVSENADNRNEIPMVLKNLVKKIR